MRFALFWGSYAAYNGGFLTDVSQQPISPIFRGQAVFDIWTWDQYVVAKCR